MVEAGMYRVDYTVKFHRRIEVLPEDLEEAEGDLPEALKNALEDEGLDSDWDEMELVTINEIQVGAE
jgi:hypothetical protein